MQLFFSNAWKKIRKIPTWLLTILVVLIVFRMVLPSVCLWAINHTLENKMGTYRGHLEDFDLSLYRGAYQLQGLTIEKRDNPKPSLLQIKEIDLSLAWRALLKKNITADVTIDDLKLQLTDSADGKNRQTGAEEPTKNWEEVGAVLVPISIETLKIKNSSVYFTNRDFKEPLPVALEKINLEAKDLRSRSEGTMSSLTADAVLQQHADLKIEGKLDLLTKFPRLDLDMKIEKFKPSTTNSLLRLYVPVDITQGEVSAYGEVAAQDGKAWGYAKVLFSEGDVIAPGQDYIGVKHFFVEIAAAVANWFLQNNETKNMAVMVPFVYEQGSGVKIDSSEAIRSAIRNRNEEIEPKIDNIISLDKPLKSSDPTKVVGPQDVREVWSKRGGVESNGQSEKEKQNEKK